MPSSERRPRVTEAEYLALEEASADKHELLGDDIVAMAGGSDRHNLIAANLVGELRSRLRDGPWLAVGSDQRHHVEATGAYTYPDVAVRCRDAEGVEPETRVVFEVLSEATEARDRGAKFNHLRQDPAVQEYVLVSQRERRVEHFLRVDVGRWALTIYGPGDRVELPVLGIVLPMDEVYLGASVERSDDPDDPHRLD